MSLDPDKVINNTVIKVHDILTANITDPKSAQRASQAPDSAFVITQYPETPVFYPHIVVYGVGGRGDRLCGNADMFEFDILLSVDVFSKSTAELDMLCDKVLKQIRLNLPSFRSFGMNAVGIPVMFRPSPMTTKGVHQKGAEYSFLVYVG